MVPDGAETSLWRLDPMGVFQHPSTPGLRKWQKGGGGDLAVVTCFWKRILLECGGDLFGWVF